MSTRVKAALGLVSARRLSSGSVERGSFASLFPEPLRRHLVRVDVRADGHCGAHVLSILNFALRRKVASPTQIRSSIYMLLCGRVRDALPAGLRREFTQTFERVCMGAYLNDADIALFLHSQNLHAHILTHGEGDRILVQSFRAQGAVGHVFLIFSHGCHWEVLARSSAKGGFCPIWTIRGGDALLAHLRATRASTFQDGANPRATYTTVLDGVPLFRIDAEDRLWV